MPAARRQSLEGAARGNRRDETAGSGATNALMFVASTQAPGAKLLSSDKILKITLAHCHRLRAVGCLFVRLPLASVIVQRRALGAPDIRFDMAAPLRHTWHVDYHRRGRTSGGNGSAAHIAMECARALAVSSHTRSPYPVIRPSRACPNCRRSPPVACRRFRGNTVVRSRCASARTPSAVISLLNTKSTRRCRHRR